MSTSDSGPVLESPYDSTTEADTAVSNYFDDSGGGGGGGDGDGNFDEYGDSSLGGSLDVPTQIEQGGAFTASGTARNNTGQEISGQFVLAGAGGGVGPIRLGAVQATVADGETVDLQFEVPRGALQLPPGKAEFGVVAFISSGSGTLATDTADIVEKGAGEEDQQDQDGQQGDGESEWGPVEFVQELPFGWNLYAQQHKTEDRTRFLVASKNSDGETIYLTKAGGISQQKVYFNSEDEIVAALQKYRERYESGEFEEGATPDPSQPRPSPEEIQADSAAGAGAGLLDAIVSGDSKAIVAGLAIAAVLLVRVLHSRGYIDKKQRRYATIGLAAGGGALALDYDLTRAAAGGVVALVGFWLYRHRGRFM